MATFKMCKKCHQVVEMIKKSSYHDGWDDTYYTCSNCGYVDKEQINRVHYGNDEIKK